jgi:uncharacterized protein YciI
VSYFLFKFMPRPDFRETMTDTEAAVMADHVAYWQALADKGTALVVGPVDDPAGAWGMAVIEVDSADQADAIMADDPVTINGLGPVAMCPLLSAIVRS